MPRSLYACRERGAEARARAPFLHPLLHAEQSLAGSLQFRVRTPGANSLVVPPQSYAYFYVFAFGAPRLLRYAAAVTRRFDARAVPGGLVADNVDLEVRVLLIAGHTLRNRWRNGSASQRVDI